MEFLIGIIGLIIATVVMVEIGSRTGLPWPALLSLLAAGAIFIPGIPNIEIPADLILPIFIPPLLWALARRTSWAAVRLQWRVIVFMSIFLVVVTAVAVGFTAYWLMPTLGLASALVIGAAIAPPDPVAVDAVAEPAGVPHRLTSTLQTEGLFNDAASIVFFNLALSVVTTGSAVAADKAVLTFLYAAGAAIALGFLIGRGAAWLNNRLSSVAARTAFTWAIPFGTFIVAEEIHSSGVIAIVIAAIEFHSHNNSGAEDRLTGSTFWEIVELIFTGVAFGLIGLAVRDAIEEVGSDLWHAVWVGTALAAVAFLVRLVWLYAAYQIKQMRARKTGKPATGAPLRLQEVLLLTWAGMRGLVTLALVLAIPSSANMDAYDELPVIALTVIFWTMVIPGLTLPRLMQALNLDAGPDAFGDQTRAMLMQRARDAVRADFLASADAIPAEKREAILQRLEESTELSVSGDPEHRATTPEAQQKRRQMVDKISAARLRGLYAAQAEMLQAREERGIDPAIVDEILHGIDAQIIATEKSGAH